MLNRLVIHLKNIIFFKAVVYTLCLIILGLLFPIFQADLEKLTHRKQKAINFLKDATYKLESIPNLEKKIIDINARYNFLVNHSRRMACRDRTQFINKVKTLGNKYNSFEPIETRLSHSIEYDENITGSNDAKIDYYILELKFNTIDVNQLLSIYKDLCNELPLGAVIVSTSIKFIDVLTPSMIAELTPRKFPNNLEIKMQIMLRSVVYEK